MNQTTYEEKPIKIKYEGEEYWFLQKEDGSGAIAPLEHCLENGELNIFEAFKSESFAHVNQDRNMRRLGKELCKIDDLIN